MESTGNSSLLAKIGLSTESDKLKFSELFHTVFNPLGGVGASTSSTNSEELLSSINPAIAAFRAVFRKHNTINSCVYLSPPKFQSAAEEAQEEFLRTASSSAKYSRESSAGSEQQQQLLNSSQMRRELKWIQLTNEWRRDVFLKTNLDEAVKKFKVHLWDECFLHFMTSLLQSDILDKSESLVQEVVDKFCSEIPSFEEKGEVDRWRDELRQQLLTVVREALEKCSEQKITQALIQYEDGLSSFLDKHLFATEAKMKEVHEEIKKECEVEPILAQVLEDPDKRAVWESKIADEFSTLEESWRRKRDSKIGEVLEELKTQGRRIVQEKCNLEVGSTEVVEAMLSENFVASARRMLEKAEVDNQQKGGKAGGGGGGGMSHEEVADNNNTDEKDARPMLIRKFTLAPIWIIFDNSLYYPIPIFPKGTKFPTSVESTVVPLSLNGLSTISIPFYECDTPWSGRPKLLGTLELKNNNHIGGGGSSNWSGGEYPRLSYHLDASGMFHAEYEVAATGQKFTLIAETCTSWPGTDGNNIVSPGAARGSGGGVIKKRALFGASSSSSSSSPLSSPPAASTPKRTRLRLGSQRMSLEFI